MKIKLIYQIIWNFLGKLKKTSKLAPKIDLRIKYFFQQKTNFFSCSNSVQIAWVSGATGSIQQLQTDLFRFDVCSPLKCQRISLLSSDDLTKHIDN